MRKKDVIRYFKTQTKVAQALDIKPPSVSEWSDIIPEKQALRLARLTQGQLVYDPELYAQEDANEPD